MTRHLRGSLPALLSVAALCAVTACGSGGSPAAGGGAAVPAPSSSATSTSAAQRALSQAIVATSALRSYAFAATQSVGAASTTTLMGEAVRPSAVTYLLNVRGKRLQIVRLANATYSRQVPGKWSRVAHPGPAVDPAASLLGLLRSISAPAAIGGSSVIHGVIPASRANAAGLPAGSAAASVSVTLDSRHRVTAVVVHTTVARAGSRPVALGLSTSYSAFNAVPAVTSPV